MFIIMFIHVAGDDSWRVVQDLPQDDLNFTHRLYTTLRLLVMCTSSHLDLLYICASKILHSNTLSFSRGLVENIQASVSICCTKVQIFHQGHKCCILDQLLFTCPGTKTLTEARIDTMVLYCRVSQGRH